MAQAMEKFRKYSNFRMTELRRLDELLQIARNSLKDKSFYASFEIRYETIEKIKDEFFKNHNLIIGLLGEEDGVYESQDTIRKNFESGFFEIKEIYFKTIVKERSITTSSSSPSNVSLPKINLPSFNGEIAEFPSFIDMFDALIHNNDTLSKIEKFKYLRTSVQGSAFLVIKHFKMTERNYDLAYSALSKRYNKTRKIALAHWSAIEDCPKITSDNPAELQRLLSTFDNNLEALQTFQLPIQHWDFILVNMILKRLPSTIISQFELYHKTTYPQSDFPTYKILYNFLLQRVDALEYVADNSCKIKTQKISKNSPSASSFFVTNESSARSTLKCLICSNDHLLYKCSEFLKKDPQERYNFAKQHKLCVNCLSHNHSFKQCRSQSSCHKCNQRHHTLLHFFKSEVNSNPTDNNIYTCNAANSTVPPPAVSGDASIHALPTVHTLLSSRNTGILLSTALVEVLDSTGNYQTLRCLLDSGSMTSFISSKAANRLGLPRSKLSIELNGLDSMKTFSNNGGVVLTIRSIYQNYPKFMIDAIILPTICADLPINPISCQGWTHISNLQLADPKFYSPGAIDLLLGADIFSQILLDGRITGKHGQPDALRTVFGYILLGKIGFPISSQYTSLFCRIDNHSLLEESVKKFWEIESVPEVNLPSPDDVQCENHFRETCQRTTAGRFVVSLPFRNGNPSFFDTRTLAVNRFISLERRLLKQPVLYEQYSSFMKEYIELGHMELVHEPSNSCKTYYIPHHCVLKPDSLTTKLRVVFNASARVPNQLSLNDHLLAGPKLQRDIVAILLHFRLHQFVLVADIKMMFRQILISSEHQDYQRIVWRFSPSEPLQDFRLKTVTYGTTSAPYLAFRTLLHLADMEDSTFPLAAQAIRSDTYVDDIVTGTSSFETTKLLQQELTDLLNKGGFELRKWASNVPSLISHLPDSHLYTNSIPFDEDACLKILGLRWNPKSDSFQFAVHAFSGNCTKRIILSHLARIFDPLGFISPVTFLLKYLIQRIWTYKLDWDQSPPEEIVRLWKSYSTDFLTLSSFNLPRKLIPTKCQSYELHCFGDASEKGYCAVAYIRCCSLNREYFTHFVSSKSKVAPLKRISLPRLELCAAVLVARLASFIKKTFDGLLNFDKVIGWTDSQVVLSWIRSSPHRWKTFVSNRVSFIQDKLDQSAWFYVRSEDNPADIGSRGLLPSELINCSAWWAGPSFLQLSHPSWNDYLQPQFCTSEITEEERHLTFHVVSAPTLLDTLIEQYSSLSKINRILGYMIRFVHNCQTTNERRDGGLSEYELHQALLILVKHVQAETFSAEIKMLRSNKLLPKSFRKLSPFLDDHGILRVGGRLANAPLSFERRHPALLPSKSRLSYLIIEAYHLRYLHAGVQSVQYLLSQQFWILSAKRSIRRVLSRCLKCWKTKPVSVQPLMGSLPSSRITQVKPFLHVGVDYAGPFNITMSKLRGAKVLKAYLCLFVCFVTKAVHLELVSNLSADAFLAALRRFICRRGRCSHIYSDCGTNFVSAARQINQFLKTASEKESIRWHFQPPSSPHFGGLWESGVKSVKSHLLRLIGYQTLTYEELSTVFIQIEAVLNSRPLTPCSNDPNDLTVLCPSMFLTLEPLSVCPEPDVTLTPLNRLSRWQLLSRIHQDFWARWSKEYLHTLYQRSKWYDSSQSLKPGMLVLIKDENCPSLQWVMGRIENVHPGTDGVVRVATVRTSKGLLKRPAVKLCPLPVDS